MRAQVAPSSRDMYSPADCIETNQNSGPVSKPSARPRGNPACAFVHEIPASHEMYKPVRAAASKMLSRVHSSRTAPPDSSGRSCHAHVRPASSEKIMPPEDTRRICLPSRAARTELIGNSPGPTGSSVHDLPESRDTKSPCSVAANQTESPKNISFTAERKARTSPLPPAEPLAKFTAEEEGSKTTPMRVQLFRCASNRASPPDASATHQPAGDEKICRALSPSSPALIGNQTLPPSSVICKASGAFSRIAAARAESCESTASETMR